jgi:hypothetical protein
MMTSQCIRCRHYRGELTCGAFPGGIPEEILVGLHDHTKQFGDEKVLFELDEPTTSQPREKSEKP